MTLMVTIARHPPCDTDDEPGACQKTNDVNTRPV